MSTIDQFKNALIGGGARSNQFRVIGGFPGSIVSTISNIAGSVVGGQVGEAIGTIGGALGNVLGQGAGDKLSFLCTAASIPSSTIGQIVLPYRGKQLKIAGDRVFEPWNIIVTNDSNFGLRKAFEQWSNLLTSHRSNIAVNNLNYMQDWKVQQLNRTGGVLETYEMRGCWPVSVSRIDLSYDQADRVESFQVILNYQYWEHTPSTT